MVYAANKLHCEGLLSQVIIGLHYDLHQTPRPQLGKWWILPHPYFLLFRGFQEYLIIISVIEKVHIAVLGGCLLLNQLGFGNELVIFINGVEFVGARFVLAGASRQRSNLDSTCARLSLVFNIATLRSIVLLGCSNGGGSGSSSRFVRTHFVVNWVRLGSAWH